MLQVSLPESLLWGVDDGVKEQLALAGSEDRCC
jgi:hypothetical protein